MKFPALLPLIMCSAVGALGVDSNPQYWKGGNADDFETCNDGDVGVGFCASGKDKRCSVSGSKYFQSIGCRNYSDLFLEALSTSKPDEASAGLDAGAAEIDKTIMEFTKLAKESKLTEEENINNQVNQWGWICGDRGVHLECPSGQALVGTCGAGEDRRCVSKCDHKEQHAIKCDAPPLLNETTAVSVSTKTDARWRASKDGGDKDICADGEVACGTCQTGSGADKKCDGRKFRMKCCPFGELNVLGKWEHKHEFAAGNTKYTIEYGTNKAGGSETTTAWADTVTKAFDAGIEVKGKGGASSSLEVTHSEAMAETYSEYWETSVTQTLELSYGPEYVGKHLWQWEFEITDGSLPQKFSTLVKVNAITDSKTFEPKCEPEYNDGGDISYQSCIPGYYLPGYSFSDVASASQ